MEEKNNMFNDMSNLFEMMDKFQAINNTNKNIHTNPQNKNTENESINNDDISKDKQSSSYTPVIKTIEAVLPHMPKSHKKTWSLMLKFLELQQLLENHNTEDEYSEIPEEDNGWRRKALVSAKPLMSKENFETIDKIIQIMDLQETFALMQKLNSN